jgi:hypothetical protein
LSFISGALKHAQYAFTVIVLSAILAREKQALSDELVQTVASYCLGELVDEK